MAKEKVTEAEFIQAFNELRSNQLVAQRIGVSLGRARLRRRHIEKKLGIVLPIADHRARYNTASINQKAIVNLTIQDGTVLVGSDAHIWPGERTIAQKVFLRFAKELKPDSVVLNGDVLDSSSNNRHAVIGWQKMPTVQEELEASQDYLNDLHNASPNSKRFWPAGNHDLNFESRLANLAPQYQGVKGMHLKDHFPAWIPCWRIDVNADLIIKHRWANGIHAVYNNVLRSGKSFVTGHLHSLKVTPWTDLTGTRYGVDTGTLAEPFADQFASYTEMNPVNWRSGFVVLTFKGGKLLWPEIASKFDDETMEFRGELIRA